MTRTLSPPLIAALLAIGLFLAGNALLSWTWSLRDRWLTQDTVQRMQVQDGAAKRRLGAVALAGARNAFARAQAIETAYALGLVAQRQAAARLPQAGGRAAPERAAPRPTSLLFRAAAPSPVAGLLHLAADRAGDPPRIAINRDACKYLVEHRPAPDVAYTPGVDVHGHAVVGADLSPELKLGNPIAIEIPLSISMLGYLPPALQDRLGQAGFDADGYLGTVTVQDNRVYLDGLLLGDPAQAALAEHCRHR